MNVDHSPSISGWKSISCTRIYRSTLQVKKKYYHVTSLHIVICIVFLLESETACLFFPMKNTDKLKKGHGKFGQKVMKFSEPLFHVTQCHMDMLQRQPTQNVTPISAIHCASAGNVNRFFFSVIHGLIEAETWKIIARRHPSEPLKVFSCTHT